MRYSTLLSLLTLAISCSAEQAPFNSDSSYTKSAAKKRPLTGRFLHLTDFHPDPHYVTGGTFSSGCHRLPEDKLQYTKGKARAVDPENLEDEMESEANRSKRKPTAGRWGSGVSDCDSPMSLVNLTFDFLKREWADKVDFVIWTGDNARHDIDRQVPRTPKEIFELNRMMVSKMQETFGRDVVIVPSIGNNDIYPHNVLAPGPNSVTSEYLRIWSSFIPQDSRHVFERGAYFSVEVIPDKLAVISLNTLFWYDSNTLVDGCRDRSSDPGAKEMDWLEVQLSEFRDRGMQVWMSGHVPPHMGHYFDNCYLRYGDLALRYQDTIVGHLFGHMNVDHFFFIDVQELEATSNADFLAYHSNITIPTESASRNVAFPPIRENFIGPALRHGPHLAQSGRYIIKGRKSDNDLGDELRKDFREMPGAGKIKLKDYAVMNVSPSVIPTYLPSVRVFTYNATGIDLDDDDFHYEDQFVDQDLEYSSSEGDDEDLKKKKKPRKGGHRHHLPKSDCSRPENEDKPHCVFKKLPRHYSKHSPSRSNQQLSPLGYIQFYLPDVDSDSEVPPKWEIEYTTFKIEQLLPSNGSDLDVPVPVHLLPGYEEGLFGGDGKGDKGDEKKREKFIKGLKRITPWKMKDLTIGSYVKLARKLVAERKMWDKFQEIMFVSSS